MIKLLPRRVVYNVYVYMKDSAKVVIYLIYTLSGGIFD